MAKELNNVENNEEMEEEVMKESKIKKAFNGGVGFVKKHGKKIAATAIGTGLLIGGYIFSKGFKGKDSIATCDEDDLVFVDETETVSDVDETV